jgi:thiol-disulfide isomerase/thioredoxin
LKLSASLRAVLVVSALPMAAMAQVIPSLPWLPPGPETVPNVAPGTVAPESAGREGLPELMVGDAAPALAIQTWVKGKPVASFEKGRVYVVEFWATWCAPCRKSIPHLSRIQKELAGKVTVVGIASQEPRGPEEVRKFVAGSGEEIGYAIGWDDEGKSNSAWMGAAGQEAIPTAFVVEGSGRIAWIGHPMDGLEAAVRAVAAGTFDLARAVRVNARAMPLKQRLAGQLGGESGEGALRTLDELIALDPETMGEYAYAKFMTLAVNAKDYPRAYAYADGAISGVLKGNADVLNALAWAIAEHPAVETRDFGVAGRAAARANELTGGKSGPVLAGLARARFGQGLHAEAVKLQEQAVAAETDKAMKEEFGAKLEEYRGKAPGAR